MTNIYAFKILVSLLVVFFTAFPAAGQTAPRSQSETGYVISVSPTLGLVYGQVEELVYKEAEKDTLMSQLVWEMKPLFLWGASLDISRRYMQTRPGFFANISARFSIPTKTGTMEDRDWQAAGGGLSHFSSHTNYTRWATFLDLDVGFSWAIRSQIAFKLYAGFNYMYFNWVAWNGYAQYGEKITDGTYTPWNENIPKKSQYGAVISYTQNWFILTPGISLYIPLYRFFAVNLDFQISPFLFCMDQDDHHLRNFQFKDYMFGGLFLEPTGEIIFSLNQKFKITANVSYRFIKGPRGTIVQRDLTTNTTVKYEDLAGTAYSALGGGVSLKILF